MFSVESRTVIVGIPKVRSDLFKLYKCHYFCTDLDKLSKLPTSAQTCLHFSVIVQTLGVGHTTEGLTCRHLINFQTLDIFTHYIFNSIVSESI